MDGRLVGYSWATPAAGAQGRVCVIDELGVIEEHRRVGVATALCRETASWMVELGFDTIWIAPFGGQAAAGEPPWFLGLGFRELADGMFAVAARTSPRRHDGARRAAVGRCWLRPPATDLPIVL